MSRAKKLAALGVVALLALQVFWYVLLPPNGHSSALLLLLFSLPLLPSLLLLIARKPSAIFWAGVAALFYFCHGMAEAWAVAQERSFALVEVALALWIIISGSWDGMQARFSKRNKPSAIV
jgi:uncharacterized membrane protein